MAAEHININSWQHRRVVFATGAMLLLILLIRTGWAAEDAYIGSGANSEGWLHWHNGVDDGSRNGPI
jgi:hypothetical protein